VDEQKQAIGDVLVSQQLLLYEPQRVGEGKIVPRGDKPHASSWLFNYLKSAQLYWNEPAIAVRFGLVLSGEKLVDHLDYREQLQQFGSEAIGGEMEGAGLYVACQDARVNWILVKAICDWADGHKAQDQEARQQLAAHNAAAFMAHALQQVALRRPESTVEPAPTAGIEKTETMLLKECMKEIFVKEDDLREFCFENFQEVYRNLKEIDRWRHIATEIIIHCKTRGITDFLWKLLRQRNPKVTDRYKIW